MSKLTIQLSSTYCNRWPEITVVVDDSAVYSCSVVKNKDITIDIPDSGKHKVEIGMLNKHFGINNVWDTKTDSGGNIVEDLTLTILDAQVDTVSIRDILLKNLFTVVKSSGQEFLDDQIYSDGTVNFNGKFVFEYTNPIMNSIINQKFKIPVDKNKSYFSNYTKIFHYEEEKCLINDIYRLLDEIK